MKNKILIILLTFCVSGTFISQVLYPVAKKGSFSQLFDKKGKSKGYDSKSGYVSISGQQIVPFKYDNAENFSDGLGRVVLEGKHGFINANGKEVIACQYDDATSFNNGYAWVQKNGVTYLIDKKQNRYDFDNIYNDDYPSEGLLRIKVNGKIGFVNMDNDLIILTQYSEANSFVEGQAVCKKNGKYVLLNPIGEEQKIPFAQCHNEFIDGRLAVQNELGKWGTVDKDLNILTPCTFDNKYSCLGLKNYESKSITVKNDKGFTKYYYDLKDEVGNQLLDNKYIGKVIMEEDRAVLLNSDYSLEIVDENLKVIKKFSNFEEGVTRKYVYKNGACLIHLNGKNGVISKYVDKDGKVFWQSSEWYSCFPKGALVSMADFSYSPIESITVGDKLLSLNQSNNEYRTSEVINVQKHIGKFEQVIVTFESAQNYYASIESVYNLDRNQLIATPNHPVLTINGVVNAGRLSNGDVVMVWNSVVNSFEERKVVNVDVGTEVKEVYNIQTNASNYVVENIVVLVK